MRPSEVRRDARGALGPRVPDPRTYCERQVATSQRMCAGCGRRYWVRLERPDPWRCKACR